MKEKKLTYTELALEFKRNNCIKSYTKLYNKMTPGLRNYVYNIVKDGELTDDIVLETMTKVYTKIDQYNPEWQITTWAYKIAYNESMQKLNERNKNISLEVFAEKGVELIDNDNLSEEHSDLFGYDPQNDVPLEVILKNDELFQRKYDLILETINNMKPIYKTIMEKKLFDHMNYKDIETQLNKPYLFGLNKLNIDLRKARNENDLSTVSKIKKQIDQYTKKFIITEQTVKNRVFIGKKLILEQMLANNLISNT